MIPATWAFAEHDWAEGSITALSAPPDLPRIVDLRVIAKKKRQTAFLGRRVAIMAKNQGNGESRWDRAGVAVGAAVRWNCDNKLR